jgi:hypothetical protein
MGNSYKEQYSSMDALRQSMFDRFNTTVTIKDKDNYHVASIFSRKGSRL